MIVSCINCYKKFDINADLIPKIGRLLECGSCNHKWFFKNLSSTKDTNLDKIENVDESKNFLFQDVDEKAEELARKINIDKSKKWKSFTKNPQKKIGILNIIVVFIISFMALIILTDTFEQPISKLIPNIEFILFNLYESIKDIMLFFNDLI